MINLSLKSSTSKEIDVSLPTNNEYLQSQLKLDTYSYQILNVETSYPKVFLILKSKQFVSYDYIFKLNNFLNNLNKENLKLNMTCYAHCEGNISLAREVLKDKDSFIFFNNLSDNQDETLGEKVVDMGLLGFIPNKLKPYLDYDSIGNDYYSRGTVYYNDLKTGFLRLRGIK